MLIHELVARQAASTPGAVAVVDGAHELTYGELDRYANQLAHLLRGAGVGSEPPVGVLLRRGRNLVVALLAVWKAGAAYVALDPEGPRRRTEGMLADSAVAVALVDEAADLDAPGVTVLRLDPELAVAGGCSSTAMDVPTTGDDPAYVLYTSGSTGRPKAVVISQDGIGNYVRWRVANHGLSAADRVLQKTALTFDAAAWEIFAPLVSGGTVVLAPAGAERDPAAMVRAVAAHRVTVLQVVPSVLRELVDEPGWAGCTALRILSSAGEPLDAELAGRFLRAVEDGSGEVEVWNTYGPTECTIDVTAYRFDPLQRSGMVSIGRPVDGMRVVLEDSGELCVGGVGVAHGYLGRPELTAERFVPDPAGPPGGRLYRTGDRCRWRADGNLEYLGRTDRQLKINGVRIEPGEVAAALGTHPAVRQVAVTSYQAANGATRLAAYVRPRETVTAAGLAAFLRDRLPPTHIPAAFVELETFPTTASGKIDLTALPAPEQPSDGEAGDAARDLVADIWRELLGVDQLGHQDDFFRLGGSSLQLIRLANRLRVASGRDVDLSALLSATTLAAQARLIEPERVDPSSVTPVPRAGALPLSFGQHRLWLQDQINPAGREWVCGLFIRVDPGTGAQAVQAALDALLERHEALRTRYTVEAGQPVQYIDPVAPVDLRIVATTRDRVGAILDQEAERGFDLARGPLVRALLFLEPAGARTLVLLVHHIACDGWSSAILEREFHELVAAGKAGRPPVLAPFAVQYADYAVWQRDRLTDDVLAAELAHWRRVLEGSRPLSPHPDRPRPRQRDGRGAVVRFTIPASLADALDEVGRRADATPFMVLLTVFATLLARHGGRWDVPIGTPVAGRERPELENVVGFFLNSLVLRCQLAADLTFEQALERVRDVCKDALAHQQLPFERLVAELAPERDPSRTPFYQVAFDFHGAELTGAPDDEADLTSMIEASGVAKTDLTLYVRRRPDGSVLGLLEYATALYERDTVVRLANHLEVLVRSVVDAPRRTLGMLDLLPDAESRALAGWSSTPAAAETTSVLDLFEERVAASGDAVALVTDAVTMSFAELDARANRLAGHLRARGVGPESVVGVLLDRGIHLPIALLAVWKAGAAYLPLDPDVPARRAGLVLADAKASVLVTGAEHHRRLAGELDGTVVLAAEEFLGGEAVTGPASRVERPAGPDLLAYVIYTSGSSGEPKGVAITHGGLAGHLRWAVAELASRGSGGAPLFSSVAFDLVVPNLWAPLLAGRPVHLLPQRFDLTELGERLGAGAPFGFIKLTPGHLEILSHQVAPGRAAELAEVIVVAGETLQPTLARRWAAELGAGRLVNEYGPTETTVGACTYPVPNPPDREPVPIGRPLPGVSMRVLDDRLHPTPIGVVGELYVGGAGVARGYLNRPAMTAEHFQPDPYGPPGARFYRTGDLARVLPGGDIEFAGRRDEQVKIRGYRVEPGEVAGVLRQHHGVRDAVVVAEAESLVAYCVTAAGVTPRELTRHCAARLPSYLLPAAFVLLDEIPLTANGKLDRAALPRAAAPEHVAPQGVVEERIADIFAELLVTSVGAHSHFIASGGNSILAIRLVAAIQAEFEITVSMRTVFEGGTVAELAAAVEEQLRAEVDRMSEEELVAAARQAREGMLG
ncbi:amino acid adenylation domain-containing protein [Frankia sp. AgPm24]|uniref:non-ribosomal peptide synthetase n=1 Tax=Frankia sp. AgPm24 TaxID=631128 RepID=UPI00200F9DFB|nr:non-ribosomal peptide synthetase [Frankia sp. AgPm24]MCK9922444.1 amino acid adenylation domain-containing protein [Frankia sp. AgPm24]